MGDRLPEAFAHRTLAKALLSGDPREPGKAETHMQEAVRIQREIGTWPELARCYVSYARLRRAADEQERAGELLTNALTMFREVGMIRHLDAATRALAES